MSTTFPVKKYSHLHFCVFPFELIGTVVGAQWHFTVGFKTLLVTLNYIIYCKNIPRLDDYIIIPNDLRLLDISAIYIQKCCVLGWKKLYIVLRILFCAILTMVMLCHQDPYTPLYSLHLLLSLDLLHTCTISVLTLSTA